MLLMSLENITGFQNTPLLFLIPAAINFFILIYLLKKLNEARVNTFFALFVGLLAFWQVSEFVMRLSETAQEALPWYRISEMLILFVLLYGNLFVFRFTRLYKKVSPVLFFFLYVFPIIVFFVCIQNGFDKVEIIPSDVWVWVVNPQPVFVTIAISAWIGLASLSMLVILWVYYFKTHEKSNQKRQLLLLAFGLTFPIVTGVVLELTFPLVLGWDDVPVSACLITFFSITSFIAIDKYNMLDFSPRHHWYDIIESISEGIIITNTNDKIMYVNKAFCDLVNSSKKQLVGTTAAMVPHNKTGTKGKTEVAIETENGAKVWVLWSETPYLDTRGTIIGSIGICTNIQQMKEAENSIKAINDELELYIYKSSHDLRGPICSMLGLINLWKKENNESQNLAYLNMLESSTKKLDETLISLVMAMKIKETHKLEDNIDFKKLIDEILIKFRHFPNFENLSITCEINIKNGYVSNQFIINTILQNIIENAIKYQNRNIDNPYLLIRGNEKDNGRIELCFEDNGIGIDPEIRSRIFEMYFRGGSGSSGSGLGLYLVKKSVEKLKGEISLESKMGAGSKFVFTL